MAGDEKESGGGFSIGSLIGTMMAIVVGISLVPAITSTTNEITGGTTAATTAAVAQVVGIIPIVNSPIAVVIGLLVLLGGLVVAWILSHRLGRNYHE